MNGNKVIRVTFGERIEQAKKKAEEEYQEKLERSKQSDVDVRDFFDDEELDRILSDNEFFNGRVANLSKMQRYEKLKLAAQWMNDHSMEVVCIDIDKPSQTECGRFDGAATSLFSSWTRVKNLFRNECTGRYRVFERPER